MTTIGFGDLYPITYVGKMITTTICYLGVAFWCLPAGIIGSVCDFCLLSFCYLFVCSKGLAIKVQEQKRDQALNRLVPAAATVIRNWWRLRCAYQGDRFVSTWKIYSLIQRRVNTFVPSTNQSSTPLLNRSERNSVRFKQTISKANNIRRKSITGIEDLPNRYVTAIKIIRILKYSSACKKFQQAKKPIDLKDVVTENTQMNNRLSTMLNDIQRRLDFALGTTKLASYLPDEQKRQLNLSARIEKVEQITNQFETKLNYLEQLAMTLNEHN
jgi:hypothetical protein